MSSPMFHGIPTGAYLPVIKRSLNLQSTDLHFHDYFPELYERFGITRDEMVIVIPQALTVDVLTGTTNLKYLEELTDKDLRNA